MQPPLTIIGIIHSELKKLEDCPRQEDEEAPEASLTILPAFRAGIKDITAGDELLLFSWLHKADRQTLSTRPRNNPNKSLTGVFSTRSPNRPNPIGLHRVSVRSVSDTGVINVSGLEVLNQTPLIDIKSVSNK
ncbi:MAG: tRNA (N6-threonylcarbamoyladenosine(37)-N6)-methyltransferase TrmO [Balneolaceae bacterium]|nr:tRNA (N6-threonylcarbamoyladenosine(37)-N6)-methyltransferase TrmO [Balneolaceae bacterium]